MNRSWALTCTVALLCGSCTRPEIPPVAEAPTESATIFSFQSEVDRIHILLKGQPFTTYHFKKQWNRPFLHPVHSLSGIEVTRGFPVSPREGESTDHPWHRGLFIGHNRINGVNFWNDQDSTNKGVLVPRSAPRTSTADGQGILTTELDLLTPKGASLGTMLQTFRFAADGDNAIIDVDVMIVADRGQDLTLGDTQEGLVCFRFDDAFKQENGATLTNSDGLVGTENIWGKRAAWVDYSTTLQGQRVGVAIFDHPSNPRHPTYWHARGYGLCTANVFGVRSFTGNDSKDGTMKVAEGGEVRFQYRFVVHPGGAKEIDIKQLYSVYSGGS